MKITKKRLQLVAFSMAAFVILWITVNNPEAASAIVAGAFALIGTVIAGFPV